MIIKKNVKLFLCGLTLLWEPFKLHASSTTNNLTVTATVTAACTVAAATLAFGNYNFSAANLDASTNIVVTCTNGVNYRIWLDGGGSGAVGARYMNLAGTHLNYSLYSDAGHTTNWGNTNGTSPTPAASTGVAANTPVYGRIPTGQSVTAGNYTDTVVITVNY